MPKRNTQSKISPERKTGHVHRTTRSKGCLPHRIVHFLNQTSVKRTRVQMVCIAVIAQIQPEDIEAEIVQERSGAENVRR